MKTVGFRLDAGPLWGVSYGHLVRCLALARGLVERQIDVRFFMRDVPEGTRLVREAGFPLQPLPVDVKPEREAEILSDGAGSSVMVLDLPEPNPIIAERLRRKGMSVAVIDNGGADMPCDLLINGSVTAGNSRGRLREDTDHCLGPDFAVLNESFDDLPRKQIAETATKLLLTFGGADLAGLTQKSLAALSEMREAPMVMIAPGFGRREAILSFVEEIPVEVKVLDPRQPLARAMAEADMAVAAGGITAYELAAAGVPAVLIPSHPREVPVVEGFAALGSAMTLSGAAPNDPTGGLAEALADLAISRARRVRMSRAGQRAVDGAGRRRVVAMILNLIFN